MILNVVSTSTAKRDLVDGFINMDTKLIKAKQDELHFVDQIIKNLHHLKHLYKTKLPDEKQLFHVENHLRSWYTRQWDVLDEINELKGYPHYEPQTQDHS